MITETYTYHAGPDLGDYVSAGVSPHADMVTVDISVYSGRLQFNARLEDLEGIIEVLNAALFDLQDRVTVKPDAEIRLDIKPNPESYEAIKEAYEADVQRRRQGKL